MKAFRKAAVIGMVVCMCATLFTGCLTDEDRRKQKEWIAELDSTFTEDKLEYEGADYRYDFSGGDKDTAIAKSKLFPKKRIYVEHKEDDSLVTNYNEVRYKEELIEYLKGIFEERFDFDSCDISYGSRNSQTPIEDMSFKKYLKKYFRLSSITIKIYKKDGIFQNEEQTVQKLLDIVREKGEDWDINLYYLTEKTVETEHDCICHYTLTMDKEGEVSSIIVKRKNGTETKTLAENVIL
jgi:hypothetical protein